MVGVRNDWLGEEVARKVSEPPEGAIQRAACLAPGLPRLGDHSRVEYPAWARGAFRRGQVISHLLIGTDGKVQKAVVPKSAGELLDCSLDVMGHAQYEPATCGNISVESETELFNTFSIQTVE